MHCDDDTCSTAMMSDTWTEGTSLDWEETVHVPELLTTNGVSPTTDLLPITLCVADKIQGQDFRKPLIGLLDSGSTSTWVNAKSLPKGIHGKMTESVQGSTLAGSFKSSEEIVLGDLGFPELHSKQSLPELKAMVFHAPCRYDVIIGRDVL